MSTEFGAAESCDEPEGSLRLDPGDTALNAANGALLQLCHAGKWRYVCRDSSFDVNDKSVVLGQLSCKGGGITRACACMLTLARTNAHMVYHSNF